MEIPDIEAAIQVSDSCKQKGMVPYFELCAYAERRGDRLGWVVVPRDQEEKCRAILHNLPDEAEPAEATVVREDPDADEDDDRQYCSKCHAVLVPEMLRCQRCGATVADDKEQESGLYCSSCNGLVGKDDRVCPQCGDTLEDDEPQDNSFFCSSCNSPVGKEDKVCPRCGEALED